MSKKRTFKGRDFVVDDEKRIVYRGRSGIASLSGRATVE